MKPLVSILIPAYNAEKWISQSLQSAVAQTWDHKEIIVVDDGSSDRTLAIARQFASKEVAVVTQQNQGASAARNHAFSLSQGDYIQWLDADDLLSADKIKKQMEMADKWLNPRILLSSGWGSFAFRTEVAQFHPTALWCDLSPLEWLIRKMSQGLHMQTATWLTSRELMQAAGPWKVDLLSDDDGEFYCRVLLASDGTRFVPDAKVFYRSTPSPRLSFIGASNKKKDAMLRSMKLHISYIRSLEDSERVRAACIAYMQIWLVHFYPERPDIVQELEALAASLGGRLEMPRLRRKYAWMKAVFGLEAAKWAQMTLPMLKASCLRSYDEAIFRLQRGRALVSPGGRAVRPSEVTNGSQKAG
jgi:glycosyltransferase involved in cell wall biosynthesis